MKRLVGLLLVHLIDPAILWCFGWRKVRVDAAITKHGPHYIDPLNPNNLWLRDEASRICQARIRSSSRR